MDIIRVRVGRSPSPPKAITDGCGQNAEVKMAVLMLKVDGSVLVIYNMGFMDHPVGELFEKVNDGEYHVVRFYRDGPNATIQVDQLPVQAKFPTGV